MPLQNHNRFGIATLADYIATLLKAKSSEN